jgi:hypothetical protein
VTEQEAIDRLYKVVDKKLTHPHYDRTVMLATDYLAYVTGEGLDKKLRRVVRRENPELFKQRLDITNHIVTATVSNIDDIFQKSNRANHRRVLEYTNDTNSDDKVQVLEDVLDVFSGELSADDWVNTRFRELNFTDPNAWMVLEWKAFDNRYKSAQPYPFEVPSDCALDFKHDPRGTLLYLIAKAVTVGANDKELTRYTLYLPNRSVSLDEIEDNDERKPQAEILAAKYWILTEHPPHNLGFVPAMRAGYKRDHLTKGRTYLAPFHPMVPYLEKCLKVNSELDLTASLHAFPIVIRTQDPCDATGCMGGTVEDMEGNRATCQACKGSGKKKPTTTQEEIVVDTPTDPSRVIDLEKLMTYKAPPIDILNWQTQYVDALTAKAKEAIFASDVFTKAQVSETATGKMIDLESVYDALYPYSVKRAAMWRFIVEGVAKITQKDAGLYARMLVQRDAKLKGFDSLMGDLKQVNDTGAGPAIRQSVEQDIARIMYTDEPDRYKKFQVRERFNPFSGQTEDKILFLLTSDLVPKTKKILYANLGNIFDKIDREMPDFYRMEAGKQVAIVDAEVAAIAAEIGGSAPTRSALNISAQPEASGSGRNLIGSEPEPTGSPAEVPGTMPEAAGI